MHSTVYARERKMPLEGFGGDQGLLVFQLTIPSMVH